MRISIALALRYVTMRAHVYLCICTRACVCTCIIGVGKEWWHFFSDSHFSDSSGPTAIAFISYSSLGNIINATFFEEANGKEQVYLNSQVVSAAIGPERNTSLPKSVILSFQHVKVGQSCSLSVLRGSWRWTKQCALPPRSGLLDCAVEYHSQEPRETWWV